MRSEALEKADFSTIRYAQYWKEADVLLDALAASPADAMDKLKSVGDNEPTLLTRRCRRVIAIDLNDAQPPCATIRTAAYRSFEHHEARELIGSTAGPRGGGLAYWNMLAPRSLPEHIPAGLRPLNDPASALHAADKACFYSAFIREEIL